VKPEPPEVIVTLATEFTGGGVPVNATVGADVYPLPPAVTVQLETVGLGQCNLKLVLFYLELTLYQLYGICRLVIMICEPSGTVKLPFLNLYS
jgi:hypothetical protein